MTAAWALKAYACVCGLLLISYFLFVVIYRVSSAIGFISSHQVWTRVAQALLILSILSPIAFHLVPARKLPVTDWNMFRPIEEGMSLGKGSKTVKARMAPRVVQTESLAKAPVGFSDVALDWVSKHRAGLVLFLLSACGGLLGLRLWNENRRLRALLDDAALIRKIGHIKVVVTDSIKIPFSVRSGGDSWVVVPAFILERGKDLALALRHELQHHRQKDTQWAKLIEVLRCALFPSPGIYLWKTKITELQELACDESLIGQKRVSLHDYGSCLVRVAEAALGDRSTYVGTTCMASVSRNPFHVKSFLRRRIEMFSSHKNIRARSWNGAILGTLAAGLTVALAFGAEQSLRSLKPANPGVLVTDPAIQSIADKVLEDAIRTEKAKAGFAIVADPSSGRILAVANIDMTQKRTGHWALGQMLEQASLFKGLVAARAIDKGLTTRSETHSCENGNYHYNGKLYHDWKKGGWTSLTTDETIAHSSDICSMKIGEKIGADGLVTMLEDFGFGPNGTAKDLPEARTGDLPVAESRPDLVPYVVSGFHFESTPIEMLQAYGAIANGGKLMTPKAANDSSEQVIRRALSPEASHEAREVLRQVFLKGTAKRAQSAIYTMAGKTATAWTSGYIDWMNGHYGDFAGFIGFAPVENPRVEIYVAIRDPESKDGAHGSTHAAPVFRRIAEEVLQLMQVPPDQTQK